MAAMKESMSKTVRVFKMPTVSLISTGNELRKPDEANLKCGQIRDANKSLLYAACKV
jgi:molybdopterin biosynthesis enzyme